MRNLNSNKGFTLMELLVAMTVFLIIVGLSSGIFLQTLRSQRTIVQISESLNNVTLALEQIAREVRTGFDITPDDGSTPRSELRFVNGQGFRVTYALIDGEDEDGVKDALGRCEGAGCLDEDSFDPITSPEIDISRLNFYVYNPATSPPRVTTVVAVSDNEGTTINLQTTVSSRILDDN